MRLLINESIFGWKLTGLLGKDAIWFFGFSVVSDLAVQYQASKNSTTEPTIDLAKQSIPDPTSLKIGV